jgi:hypothetical protein
MTTDGLLGERPNESQLTLARTQILDLCDRIVGEIGRRAHIFGWLRGADDDRWLTVDAYYPGQRLVVVFSDVRDADGALIAERVPARGMRLLQVSPPELGDEPARARELLEDRIAALGPAPPRPRDVQLDPAAGIVSRALESLATPAPALPAGGSPPGARPPRPVRPVRRVGATQAEAVSRATRFVANTRRWVPSEAIAEREAAGARVASVRAEAVLDRLLGPPDARAHAHSARSAAQQVLGITLGVVLLAVLLAEVYFGVDRFAITGGHVLLALALALDACARVLGTVAAERASDQPAAWWCAIGGGPFVAGFALLAPGGPVRVEPAPLAGLVALAACGLAALWFVGAALGI